MMKNPRMLYRCPGPQVYEGVACETTIVDESEVEAAQAEGWCFDWMQAKAAHEAPPPSLPRADGLGPDATGEDLRAAYENKPDTPMDKAAICAALDAAGVTYDKRLSAEKLAALLPKG
jgi:hypothetical protein